MYRFVLHPRDEHFGRSPFDISSHWNLVDPCARPMLSTLKATMLFHLIACGVYSFDGIMLPIPKRLRSRGQTAWKSYSQLTVSLCPLASPTLIQQQQQQQHQHQHRNARPFVQLQAAPLTCCSRRPSEVDSSPCSCIYKIILQIHWLQLMSVCRSVVCSKKVMAKWPKLVIASTGPHLEERPFGPQTTPFVFFFVRK